MIEVEVVARRVPGWGELALRIEPVEIGITNRNYKVTLPDGTAWMLRLPGERTEVLGIDRACEAEAAVRAAALGIGPPVLGELPGMGTLVTRFVGGRHAADDATFAARLPRWWAPCAPSTAAAPSPGGSPSSASSSGTPATPRPTGWRRPPCTASCTGTRGRWRPPSPPPPTPAVPCHNDLLPANVLFDERPGVAPRLRVRRHERRLLRPRQPGRERALSPDAEEPLLRTYFGAVTPSRWARLQLMKIMSELREGMWAVVQQAISTLTHVDFVAYADERLGNCARLLDQPEVAGWRHDASQPA